MNEQHVEEAAPTSQHSNRNTTTPPTTARASSAGRVSSLYNELLNRPRSNPRSRTPMRYESPLDPDAFRRSSVLQEEEAPTEREQRQSSVERRRRTIRPMAGAPVGTMAPGPIGRHQAAKQKSSKQGPSRRKVQRWTNDNFRHLAAEIKAAGGSAAVTDVLMQAHMDAHLYRDYFTGPKTCSLLNSFYQEESYGSVRKEFFQGEIGTPSSSSTSKAKCRSTSSPLKPEQMLNRVHGRLIKVIERVHSSSSSQDITDQLEMFLVQSLGHKDPTASHKTKILDRKRAGLKKYPTLVHRQGNNRVVQFIFEKEAGLSRLFLHAVCQFHGLQVRSATLEAKDDQEIKGLVVSGRVQGEKYRFLDYIGQQC